MGIYAAGYMRTQAAADRFASDTELRRPRPLAAAAPLAVVPPEITRADEQPSVPAPEPASRPTPDAAPAPATPAPVVPAPRPALEPALSAAPVVPAAPLAPAVEAAAASVAAPIAPQAVPALAVPAAAPAADPAVVPAATPVAPRYKDGSFLGWGTSRHGDMAVTVVVESGRITSAKITDCQTRWPCTWVEALPGQVVARQSAETDYVSGATQSTNAFYYAVVDALGKATVK